MTDRLYLYDTTLRDGQQTQGVQFSTPEKGRIAAALDALGLDYIEAAGPVLTRPTARFSKQHLRPAQRSPPSA